MFYYAFLTGLFALAISIVLSTLDPYVPTFQTRVQAPGIVCFIFVDSVITSIMIFLFAAVILVLKINSSKPFFAEKKHPISFPYVGRGKGRVLTSFRIK